MSRPVSLSRATAALLRSFFMVQEIVDDIVLRHCVMRSCLELASHASLLTTVAQS